MLSANEHAPRWHIALAIVIAALALPVVAGAWWQQTTIRCASCAVAPGEPSGQTDGFGPHTPTSGERTRADGRSAPAVDLRTIAGSNPHVGGGVERHALAEVAQSAEHPIPNRKVAGSMPARRAVHKAARSKGSHAGEGPAPVSRGDAQEGTHALRTTTAPTAIRRGGDHGSTSAPDAGPGADIHAADAYAEVGQEASIARRRVDAGRAEAAAVGADRHETGDSARVPLGVAPVDMVASLEWTLARCMWAEAGPLAIRDHAAIAHAIGKQARAKGIHYGDQLIAYCHGLRGGRARVDRETALYPEVWRQVQWTADEYLRGRLANPCPGATHWGGYHADVDKARIDAALAAGRLARVRCSGETKNHFFREVRP